MKYLAWSGLLLMSIAMASAVLAQHREGNTQSDSAEIFSRLAPVLQHPRCMNCHTSTDFPRQGDDRQPHRMQVRRGLADQGVAALPCWTCHQTQNASAGVPGAHSWHLAPLRMAWEGLSVGEICRALTDPSRGGMTPGQLVTHLATDPLVHWAWEPGVDLNGQRRKPPPILHADFIGLVDQWIAAGAKCPD